MSTKNIQLFIPKFRKEEIFEEIGQCLDKGWTGLGFKTLEVEEAWKKYTGLKNAHFLNSNTSGLHLALKILKDVNKWKSGDEVITTPLTFVSTNHAILYENLKPVFADVDQHLCLDPTSVLKNITKKTKAVIFVGIGGNTGQLLEISDICEKYGLKLILDAAHMAGTRMQFGGGTWLIEEHVSSLADVCVFSFQAVKNLPTADSGMICFRNKDYDTLARKLSWLGIDKDTYQRSNSKGTYKWEYDLIDAGFKYHGNSIMASMALVGLKYLEEDNAKRRQMCEYYEDRFKETGITSIKMHSSCAVPSRHLYQIVVSKRDELMSYLNTQGIYPGVHYRSNTSYKMYEHGVKNCPNAIKYSDTIITLPLHLHLTASDLEYVADKVIQGYNLL